MKNNISNILCGLCFLLIAGAFGQDMQAQKLVRANKAMASVENPKNNKVNKQKPTSPKDEDHKIVGEMYSVEMSPTSSKNQPEAIIHLFNRSKAEVAVLKFHSSSLGAQKSNYDKGTGVITVYYDLAMLPYFLDVLSAGQKLEIEHTSRSGDVTVSTQMSAVRGAGGGVSSFRPATRGKMAPASPTRTPATQKGK